MEKIKIQIKSSVGEISFGEIEYKIWTQPERFKRAAKIWLSIWGGALFSVFVPFAHFVLVPSLLIAGPVMGMLTYKREKYIVDGAGQCPHCENSFKISPGSLYFPMTEVCRQCSFTLDITQD